MRTIVIASLGLLALQCPPSPVPPPPDASDAAPPPVLDAAPAPADAGPCASWCASWRERGCKEGAPTCEATCAHVQAAHLTTLDPNVCTKASP